MRNLDSQEIRQLQLNILDDVHDFCAHNKQILKSRQIL